MISLLFFVLFDVKGMRLRVFVYILFFSPI